MEQIASGEQASASRVRDRQSKRASEERCLIFEDGMPDPVPMVKDDADDDEEYVCDIVIARE